MANKITVSITGLHCRACEILSEERLEKINGLSKAKVNHRTGQAELYYKSDKPDLKNIKVALEELGYQLVAENSAPLPQRAVPKNAWLSALLLTLIIYLLISRLNYGDLSSLIQQEFSWPLALLIGLVAGVSTCLALIGGLVLGVSANYNKNNPTANRWQKFQPHLLFSAGRIGGFFLLGGLLGLIGETFRLSSLFNGALTITVALVLLILGFKLLDIFPIFNKLDIVLPKSLGHKIKAKNTLILGALTFFLPCGFTQAMQIYALSSGNFFTGGLIMALFALGTAPGLLGIGGASSFLSAQKTKKLFIVAGVIVIIFGLFNLNNGLKLIRVNANLGSAINQDSNLANKEKNEKNDLGDPQIIRMIENNRGYEPDRLTAKVDRPVRWIIDAQAPYSCASSLIVPKLNIRQQLKPGENIIEFTPQTVGTIPFSCSMGMYTGTIEVIK